MKKSLNCFIIRHQKKGSIVIEQRAMHFWKHIWIILFITKALKILFYYLLVNHGCGDYRGISGFAASNEGGFLNRKSVIPFFFSETDVFKLVVWELGAQMVQIINS